MTLTVASLFAGIGGFDLAFQRAGANVVAAVEIDKAARVVLARHFPDTALFDDVTEVSGDDLRAAGFVAKRGVVTAGWPCQDFSVAGRRAGLAGARSGLWWEVVRILADLQPRWFVGENVPGLLSSVCEPVECVGGCMQTHGGAMGSVLGSLAELGYGVAYRVLDAQYFGVPQQRRRVFIVGHLGAPFGAAAQVLLEPEGGGGDSAAGRAAGADVADAAAAGIGEAGRDVAQAVTARYGKGAESDADDALLLDGIEHTHTHTQRVRCRRCRAAGNGATGSTPSQQRAAISSSRGCERVDD
jgi:DNA (cytosine-5)-methyltransferase 1